MKIVITFLTTDHSSLRHPHELAILGHGGRAYRRRRPHLQHVLLLRPEDAPELRGTGERTGPSGRTSVLRQPRHHSIMRNLIMNNLLLR